MPIPDQLKCLFSAKVEARDDSHVIEVPKSEVDKGTVDPADTYQLAVLSTTADKKEPEPASQSQQKANHNQPPVTEGESRIVEIEDVGDQGDGITRVERGYVIIVPEAQKGERVTIEIETVRENVAFGLVTKRLNEF